MPNFPNNIFEFNRRFSSEDACWSYLKEIRWPKRNKTLTLDIIG